MYKNDDLTVWIKAIDDVSRSTRVVESCWGMLLWISNLNIGKKDNGKSAAKPNNMSKIGLTKTSKLKK
jgi:hypothetical protein